MKAKQIARHRARQRRIEDSVKLRYEDPICPICGRRHPRDRP